MATGRPWGRRGRRWQAALAVTRTSAFENYEKRKQMSAVRTAILLGPLEGLGPGGARAVREVLGNGCNGSWVLPVDWRHRRVWSAFVPVQAALMVATLMTPASQDYHFSFSLIVLGDQRVGKSQLIACTLPEEAAPETAELGADHGVLCKTHTYESRGARYQIHMWEVPGAPRHLKTADRYASVAAGVLLVFDLTRRATFERASLWLDAVEASSPELPRVLVGNKSDGETQVTAEEAVALAQKHGCKYFETSAIRNEQVPEAFSSLIARVVAQIPNPPEPSLLLRKRIQIGKALADNKSFRAALFDYSPKV